MRNKKTSFSFKGKGYYIALILCAVAIGISGYLYYQNTHEPALSLQDPGTQPGSNGDAQVIATAPGLDPTTPTQKPTEDVK